MPHHGWVTVAKGTNAAHLSVPKTQGAGTSATPQHPPNIGHRQSYGEENVSYPYLGCRNIGHPATPAEHRPPAKSWVARRQLATTPTRCRQGAVACGSCPDLDRLPPWQSTGVVWRGARRGAQSSPERRHDTQWQLQQPLLGTRVDLEICTGRRTQHCSGLTGKVLHHSGSH